MKITLTLALEDWRDSICAMCAKEINPHIRLCYDTLVTDEHDNPIADFEIDLCKTCASKAEKNWRKALR